MSSATRNQTRPGRGEHGHADAESPAAIVGADRAGGAVAALHGRMVGAGPGPAPSSLPGGGWLGSPMTATQRPRTGAVGSAARSHPGEQRADPHRGRGGPGRDPVGQGRRRRFRLSSTDVAIGEGEEKVTTTTEATTTTVAEQAPQTVQVVAANGSGASGMAAKAGQVLAQNGYTQVVTTNALQPVTAPSVLYATGHDANARSIARQTGLAESVVQPLAAGTQLPRSSRPPPASSS